MAPLPDVDTDDEELEDWVAEWVRSSTAAQGLPEYVEDPVVGDAIARLLVGED